MTSPPIWSSRTSTHTGTPIAISRRRSATGLLHRGLERVEPATALVRRAGDLVEVGAAGAQRLLALDRFVPGVERVGVRTVAREVERLHAREPAVGERRPDLDDREGSGDQ